MSHTTTNILVLLATLITPFVFAQGGGALGGNPSVETGAVNVSVGKCTQYKMDVKAAQQANEDTSTITVPEGCEAITEK
ncbi:MULTISPECIES: hypothetical protein [Vibrio]|uniref:hypothetical protein n=1 Tax=Vibrio TaxID=662 RepID=UPI0001B94379|nr:MULTISPECIES: hypothetical protein [Vibrio]ANW25169.1 hypothetical protein BA953_13740 [Vibrio coralliilyticus]EEX35377.1 hypothetical protein VIC_000165 [Vibrio coralliilyticus ATCC BAA-450]KJY90124.1 hypothetical protein TW84_10960 [Vibrio neptunius]MDE3900231.1 hypothetical protein [Vibrio sp. CC007]